MEFNPNIEYWQQFSIIFTLNICLFLGQNNIFTQDGGI
jgi:hypothetical protein